MKFKRDERALTGNYIITEHNGKELIWNISTYRELKVNDELIFDINNYWSRLPIETQDRIWTLYEEIYNGYEEIESTEYLNNFLIKRVTELFTYHSHEDIMKYYHTYSRIKLPTDLKDNYVENLDPKLTYLRPEYLDLIGMAIILKIMLPIWGVYINIVGKEVSTNIKEYRAAALIRQSNLVTSPPYKRLLLYIQTYWEGYTGEKSSAAIVAGIDTANMPLYLMGNALIRRVSVAELTQQTSNEKPIIIISTIFNYINNIIENMDKIFGGRINEKSLTSGNQGDDDNTSVVENYKIKQDIPEGVLAMHEIHIRNNHENILLRMLDGVKEYGYINGVKEVNSEGVPLFDIVLDSYRGYLSFWSKYDLQPNFLSISLCKWVLDPLVSAKILDYVNYEALSKAHYLTSFILEIFGYQDIAKLVLAKRVMKQEMNNVVRLQVTDDQLVLLDKIYPHSPNTNTKRKPSRRDSNVAIVGIRYLLQSLYNSWWSLPSFTENGEIRQEQYNEIFNLPANIEPRLADLIIYLKTYVHKGKYGLNTTIND